MIMDDKPTTEKRNNTNENDSARDGKGRWKKGHCPNPSGRPKGPSITSLLRKMSQEVDFWEEIGEAKRCEILALKIWKWALDGNRWAVDVILDRVDGMIEQPGVVTGADLLGKRIVIERRIVEADGATVN